LNTTLRVREYASILKKSGADSRAAASHLNAHARDLAFLAYAAAMVRVWIQHESSKNLQENRRNSFQCTS
jgi:hypothetical protein